MIVLDSQEFLSPDKISQIYTEVAAQVIHAKEREAGV
jgi:hypothetical protein